MPNPLSKKITGLEINLSLSLKCTWYPLSVSKGMFSPSWSVNFFENAPDAITDFSNLYTSLADFIIVSFTVFCSMLVISD